VVFKERFKGKDLHRLCCRIKGIDDKIQPVHSSSMKLLELGFEYKNIMEEMFNEAIHTCMEKLIPLKTVESVVLPENGKSDEAIHSCTEQEAHTS